MVGDLSAIATGKVTAALLSLFTVLMTTRLLGPSGYGVVALFNIVGMLIFTASSSWTGVSVRRYGREELERQDEMSTLTWNRAVIAVPLLLIAVAVVVALKFTHALPDGLSWDIVVLALAMGVTNVVFDHWVCLLETSGRMKTSAGGQVLSQALYVGALAVIFAAGWGASPRLVAALALGSSAVFAIAMVPILWRTGIVPVRVDRKLLRRMLWLSVPVIGLVVSQYVFSSVDVILLGVFRSQHDVGVYAVAYQAYTVLSAAAITATAVFLPLFVSLQMAERQHLIVRYMERSVPQLLLLISVLAGIGIAIVPLVVPVVFGAEFSGASEPLAILGLGLAFLFAAYLIAPILTLHEKTRATAAINVVAAVINVAADVIMLGVFHLGIVAPAIATSGALGIVFVAFYVKARRTLGTVGWPDAAIALPAVAALVAALTLAKLPAALIGVGAAAVLGVAIVLLRSPFTRDDVELLEKLDMPASIKRAAIRAIRFVT